MVDERVELAGQHVGHDRKPVAGAGFHPFGDQPGHAFRGSGVVQPAGQSGQSLRHGPERGGGVFGSHLVDGGAEARLRRAGEEPGRERGVRVDGGVVQPGQVGQVPPAELAAGSRLQLGLERRSLRVGAREQEGKAGQDPHLIGVAPVARGLGQQVFPERYARIDTGQRGEHGVGVPGGERYARRRGTGLGQERMPLRRARERQVAGHVEVCAVVPGRVQPGRVGPLAGLPRHDRGVVVVPGVPELEHDLDVLAGPLIPVGRRRMGPVAEVARGGGLDGGDDVPSGPPVAEEIKRGHAPGHVPRVAVRG